MVCNSSSTVLASLMSQKLLIVFFYELLNVTEKLGQLNSAHHFEAFYWEDSDLCSLALDLRLFVVISNNWGQPYKKEIDFDGKTLAKEKSRYRADPFDLSHWSAGSLPVDEGSHSTPSSTGAVDDRSVLEQLQVRDRLKLPRDLSTVPIGAPGNREKLVLVMEHGALSLNELDALARIAAKELDREMLSVAHSRFTEQFCSPKWSEIESLACHQNQEIVILLAEFKKIINSAFGESSFAGRLTLMDKVIEKIRKRELNATKLCEWLQSELESLEPLEAPRQRRL